MSERVKDHLLGARKLSTMFAKPSFLIGGSRSLFHTLLNNRDTTSYSLDKETDSSKDNVVIFPGWGSDGGTYEPLAEKLRDSFNVYSPDNLPRGFSALFSRLNLEEQARLALEYLNRFKTVDRNDGTMNLVCHSNGGLVALLALKLAEEKGENGIGKVITMATALKPSKNNLFGFLPGFSQRSKAISELRYGSHIYNEIQPFRDRVSLSLVSERDELFSPEIQFVNEERAKRYADYGHFGYFRGEEELSETAQTIQEEINAA